MSGVWAAVAGVGVGAGERGVLTPPPALTLSRYAITRAALSEENPDRRGVFAVGVIGGAFGLVNLFWPSMVLQGRLFDFFSRLADSTL